MRTLAEAVFLLLQSFAPYSREPDPETALERDRRLLVPTVAIVAVALERPAGADPVDVAALLADLGGHESNFAAYVGRGHCARGPVGARCDPVRGVATSRTYWQLKRPTCPAAWDAVPGSLTEALAAARCASRLWLGAYYRCRKTRPDAPEAGAFAGYMGGAHGCHWPGADTRARSLVRTRYRLRLLLDQK